MNYDEIATLRAAFFKSRAAFKQAEPYLGREEWKVMLAGVLADRRAYLTATHI